LANHLHIGDLPAGIFAGVTAVAVDSETLGLRFRRDPLCLVQISAGDGDAHMVQLNRETYDAPNLKALLEMMLAREGRTALAQACFDFLPARSTLDLAGWEEVDIFAHS
jgi:ribonuclease D